MISSSCFCRVLSEMALSALPYSDDCRFVGRQFGKKRANWCRSSIRVLRVWPPGIEWKTGRDPKMGKNWPKNRKWPWAPKWRKNGIWGHFSIFRHFWAIFSSFRAEGHFLFFGQFFPIFGFRPVFHSIPGGQTRNQSWAFLGSTFGILLLGGNGWGGTGDL